MQSVLADAIHIVDCIVGIKRNYRIMMPCTICTVCIVGNRIVIICIICNKWLMPVVMYAPVVLSAIFIHVSDNRVQSHLGH